jgi:hypothetical protein
VIPHKEWGISQEKLNFCTKQQIYVLSLKPGEKQLIFQESPAENFTGQSVDFSAAGDRIVLTHIPHPKLSQREITEIKNPNEHKNKHNK